ncbi:hypothetical protein ACFFX1_10885 [Dactylosporangium sucinum]|uniref:HTH iclR-type domain-containing protein n=1 Tax=Dactylosporangium sucinum TaxID=1424081 RepID=A0A917THS1_9ACTN|nr:hypothetical protein [Dactylosporangium sucinum]GGM22825.1 hypothetical protein GCM10007977_025030 [Dactylosporangium sucinum]
MDGEHEDKLLGRGFDLFRELIDFDGVEVTRDIHLEGHTASDDVWLVRVRGRRAPARIVVLAFRRFAPRFVDALTGGLSGVLRQHHNEPVIIVAPWLSRRSRELLQQHRINYLDLTGNVWVRMADPPLVLHTHGADHDPHPGEQPRRGLQGKLVNGIVRALVDAAPPYRMSELAAVTGASPAYVSRTLDALDQERLIERARNRLVVDVDWEQLLRERARSYALTSTNRARPAIARRGLPHLLDTLRAAGASDAVVTGSTAVQRYVRIAAPAQLALYVPDFAEAAMALDLMPAERGANVLLLKPAHPSQLDRPEVGDGLRYAGISQLALDCLGGNGRLPEEGEALLAWMREHTTQWRRSGLDQL